MFFIGLPAILVAITAGISDFCKQLMSTNRALNKESSYEISLKLDKKCSRCISYSSQIVFFQSLHYTCFSSAVCPLQVSALDALQVLRALLLQSYFIVLNKSGVQHEICITKSSISGDLLKISEFCNIC